MRKQVSDQTRFLRDCRGGVAIPFAFAVIALSLMIGLAVDGGRAYSARQKIAAILDAAALAGAKALHEGKLSDDEVRAFTEQWITNQMPAAPSRLEVSTLAVTIKRASNTIDIQLNAKNGNFIAGLAGHDYFILQNKSSATFGVTKVELGLMLDVSGSMRDFGKIDDLKAAVTSLVNVMIPEGTKTTNTRIGLAPYSSAVNAGAYASKVRSGTGKCVSERKGSKAFTDETPQGNPLGNKAWSCPANEVTAMTSSRSALLAKVDELNPDGATAGHLGAAWAWYLVSPSWAEVWPDDSKPAAYGEKNTYKAVVLMTDGMFNTQYELISNGKSEAQAANLCTNMKAAGVIVFTIGFQAPATVLPTLEKCATSPGHFFDAGDGGALTAAFNKIAERLSQLRLSN